MASEGSGDAQEREFGAFLSYSHADKQVAQKLHSQLENYGLPKRLRPQEGRMANGKLGPIFRDREDFPAANDLSDAVKAALERSRALVVLCTPDAKASEWVAKEIALFRELHPDRPILAALQHGEPEEAFPDELTRDHEPLAADLRKAGDGRKLGFLKLVAGIADVPLDALIQRDAARRLRRVIYVTGLSLAAVLAMLTMTVFAIQQRNEAEAQRNEAEGLVEFMLTDLRGELREVGRLEVMDGVNQRAMDYYDSQGDIADLPAESLERRARVLHAMGEDAQNLDKIEEALDFFREAHRATASLLDREPGNAQRVFNHAQSEYWVGFAAYMKDDWATAERHWQGYETLAAQLRAIAPENAQFLREAGYAAGNLCTLNLHREDEDREAWKYCQEALELVEESAARDPADSRIRADVANRFGWVGEANKQRGDMTAAIVAFREQHSRAEAFRAEAPQAANRIDLLMRAKMALAENLGPAGEPEEAALYRAEATALATEMTRIDPANATWANWLDRLQRTQ